MRCSLTTRLARHSPGMPPMASAGWNRHQLAANVLVPAAIRGGDQVSEELPPNLAISCRFAIRYLRDAALDLLDPSADGVLLDFQDHCKKSSGPSRDTRQNGSCFGAALEDHG